MACLRVRACAAITILIAASIGGAVRAQPADIEPPRVLEHIDAIYPSSELAQGTETTVVVHVTVEKDGHVSDAEVVESGGAAFDEAALAAVQRWRFQPATKAGVAVRARIRVPFHFAPGAHPPAAPPPKKPAPPGAPKEPPYEVELGPSSAPHAVVEKGKAIEVHVQGRPNPPPRGTSDFRIDDTWLRAAPHASAGAMLRAAPGFTVTRPEGDAIAHRIMLRGFDADHGQDIALRVGGIPLNQPSHIHGQGYADLQAIIPETVRSLRVVEGVYDPRQGDFAVAGSVDFDLGVVERGLRIGGAYGSFHEKRLLVLWAPVGESEDTFAAAEVKHTEGFGDGTRGALSGGASGQYRFDLPADISGLVHLAVHGARANFAGVLRRDDVDSGRIGFYDAYPDPSARSQSALTTRSELGTRFDRTGDDGSAQGLGIWTTISTFRQRMNLTGYTQRSRENPEWAGRGDLIEQHNDTLAFGGNANYRTRRFQPAEWLRLGLEVGAEGDTHGIEQAQNLLQAPQNETWDRRVDATVRVSHAGVFVDGFAGTRWITLRGGLRADVLLFDIDDRLGNFIPAFQEPSHIVGFRRTAAGIAWGPRVTLESDPLPWLKLSAS
ncbi:MAG TPA: TonB family protein, partial [Polyangiaceae bacterium]|nr:TonB family protein [Polyangiaceae bacterium]